MHKTVLLKEAVDYLDIKKDHYYVDATFGRGGHTREILSRGGKVIAFDFDHEAIEHGNQNFAEECKNESLILIRENFDQIDEAIKNLQKHHTIGEISGILFDFGTSTEQLTSSERGFSFDGDGPLDMRMDDRLGVQAKDLLAIIPTKQLAQLFSEMGGEHDAFKIAKAIKESPTPITTIKELTNIIAKVKRNDRHSKINPSTKVFQALRIAVNTELSNIETALPKAFDILEKNARIVTIAFHEGEDRIVKHLFKTWEENKQGINLLKKPLSPSEEELEINQRARSAKLRVFEKQNQK